MSAISKGSLIKMLEFSIKNRINNSGKRIGSLELNKQGETLETPGFLLHTQSGSVPHLSNDALQSVHLSSNYPISISLDKTYTFSENVSPSNLSISQFVGLHNHSSFFTLHDPLQTLPLFFNDKNGISFWTRKGRKSITGPDFIKIVENYNPDFFQTLSDYDVYKDTSAKRIKKSIIRNLDFCDSMLGTLKNSTPFVTVELAWFIVDEVEALKALAAILEKQNFFSGFVLNGIREFVSDYNQLKDILHKIPEEKAKFCPGLWSFNEILNLSEIGIDLFDSSLVTKLSENNSAISESFSDFIKDKNLKLLNEAETLPVRRDEKFFQEENPRTIDEDSFIIDLKDKQYFNDFRPLAKNCSCTSCRKHTRAYIHHLLSTSELLGPILLMQHNLFQFELFFKAIKENLSVPEGLKIIKERVSSYELPEVAKETDENGKNIKVKKVKNRKKNILAL